MDDDSQTAQPLDDSTEPNDELAGLPPELRRRVERAISHISNEHQVAELRRKIAKLDLAVKPQLAE